MSIKVHKYDETALLAAAKADNVQAFDMLLANYQPQIKRIISHYFLKTGDRDDLMQEASIGFLKAVRDYNEEATASFATFMRLCIERQVITAIKGATRKKHELLTNSLSLDMPLSASAAEEWTLLDTIATSRAHELPEKALLAQEREATLLRHLAERLTTFESAVVNEYIAGKSYAEIAQTLAKSEKAIDNALQRIRKKALR